MAQPSHDEVVRQTSSVSNGPATRRYTTTLEAVSAGRARVPVPFDPNSVWGVKREHHVVGTIAGMSVRGIVARDHAGWRFSLGAAWLRDCPIGPGDRVEVVLSAEGPQRGELASDISTALEANPAAAQFFDSLAQFYRKGYLRWIDATKRRPERREQRIAETVQLLAAEAKERPRSEGTK